ncbi:Txe/YoeB family addiction module toxin [Pedobacter sp. GR22-10]|uniref:Txe/YoeB family addiction module toxin n=1 Tax=Pedobacter sp. GR22-10 TaxID=2994472 RepID=UPI00224691F6|nr:Txe/YoeB family addiction module toxin [Pedobacter sp. GR22-10]MCX2433282.1 Txe/YoeB family addiction module toxin [Pedobacter sp. GR22-10]
MEIAFDEVAENDLLFWKKSGNKAIQNKIQELIQSIVATPFSGIGKPEALKYNLTGKWSRRINSQHRIIYEVLEDKQIIKIHSLKGHYH